MSAKIPTAILRKRIELLTLEQLREFAYNVTFMLYGTYCHGEGDEEFPPGTKQGDTFLDQDSVWTQENIELVDDNVRDLRLHPAALEEDFETGSLDDSTNDDEP